VGEVEPGEDGHVGHGTAEDSADGEGWLVGERGAGIRDDLGEVASAARNAPTMSCPIPVRVAISSPETGTVTLAHTRTAAPGTKTSSQTASTARSFSRLRRDAQWDPVPVGSVPLRIS
jgi:hypothetical protein